MSTASYTTTGSTYSFGDAPGVNWADGTTSATTFAVDLGEYWIRHGGGPTTSSVLGEGQLRDLESKTQQSGLERCYQYPKDPGDAKHFHNYCGQQGSVLMVIKSSSGRIFGGYNHPGLDLNVNGYANGVAAGAYGSRKSFLFRVRPRPSSKEHPDTL
mmetsp:Transcript_33071/g.105372  ORF Transcript_33071/g.105372 Transcript_33071/m.105372 type:complete len:157 (-) Transcript_33071:475-945(-)